MPVSTRPPPTRSSGTCFSPSPSGFTGSDSRAGSPSPVIGYTRLIVHENIRDVRVAETLARETVNEEGRR
jgi:hypothetical protein